MLKFQLKGKRFFTLIQPKELLDIIKSNINVRILDATLKIPGVKFNPLVEHFKSRIPNSTFFDADEVADKNSEFPHTLPDAATWGSYMKLLNFSTDLNQMIVVYDRLGVVTSPRAWWMFKVFGFENSGRYQIYDFNNLNGNIPRYEMNSNHIATHEQVVSISKKFPTDYQILDARPATMFSGEQETYPDFPAGHIPNSINLHFAKLLTKERSFKTKDEIIQEFKAAGVSMNDEKTVVNSCGSGVTACINAFAMDYCGKKNWKVYDGSWTLYASSGEKIEKGK